MGKQWYAVYTKPRWEKKVADSLTKRKIENYCPLNKVLRQWNDRKKLVHEPLFVSYVFVYIDADQEQLVRKVDGIINLVYWLKKPAIIRSEEIEIIRKFLNDYSYVHLEKTPVNLDDSVRIIGGPLMNQEGNVLSVKNKFVKVILPSLGYLMIAQIDIHNVQVVAGRTKSLEQYR